MTSLQCIVSTIVCVLIIHFNPTDAEALRVGDRKELRGFPLREVDLKCKTDFLERAPSAWQKLERSFRNFEVGIVFSNVWESDGALKEMDREWIVTVPSDGRLMLVSEKSTLRTYAANENYSFRLERASKDERYVLSRLQPWPSRSSQPLFGALTYNNDFFQYWHQIWWVPCDYILDNMGSNGFEIVHARYVEHKNAAEGKVAQIAFRYNGETKTRPYPCETGVVYWAEFVPDQNWVIVRSGVTGLTDGNDVLRIRVESSYQHWFGGEKFPKDIVLAYEVMGQNRIVEVRRTSIGEPRPMERLMDEFYLPHYGISEAVVPRPAAWGRWLIMINLAAILLLLAAILFHRCARRQATQ